MDGQFTILLVDDDPDYRLLIRDAIASVSPSCRVEEAINGRQALDFLHRRGEYADAPVPDLIYLDVEMPEMNGHKVLKIIKSDEQLKEIPVVMMTGLDDDNTKRMAARNGANSYTHKPTDPGTFLKTVVEATNYWIRVHKSPLRSEDTRKGELDEAKDGR